MKKLTAFLLAVLLVFCTGVFAVSEEDDETVAEMPPLKLPIDFSPGNVLNPKFFVSDTVYEDPTIKVVITAGDDQGRKDWIADIEIADASQLRTASAEGMDLS